jgi:hypothetical protein
VPFDTTLLRLDGVDLSDPGAVALVAADPATLSVLEPSHEWFGSAGFRKLTTAEAVNQPSYAELPSGRVFTLTPQSGPVASAATNFRAYVRRPAGLLDLGGAFARVLHHERLLASVTGRAGAPACTDLSSAVSIDRGRESAWQVAGGGSQDPVNSQTEAYTRVALAATRKSIAACRVDDRVSLGGVL